MNCRYESNGRMSLWGSMPLSGQVCNSCTVLMIHPLNGLLMDINKPPTVLRIAISQINGNLLLEASYIKIGNSV